MAANTSPSPSPRLYQSRELDHAPVLERQAEVDSPADLPSYHFGGDVVVAVVIGPTGHVIDARVRDCTVEDFFCRTLDFDAAGNAIGPRAHKYPATSATFSKLQMAAAKFSAAAVQSARQLAFRPGLKNGLPVYSVVALNIPYNGGIVALTIPENGGAIGFGGTPAYMRGGGIGVSPSQFAQANGRFP